jgi:Flp pilus assembly secretin CpaC
MRYLSLLAAILASTPVCATEFTDTLEIPPGFAKLWAAPRPFTDVMIGNPEIVDAKAETNQALVISMKKPEGGATNIVLLDGHGEQIANVLVTNPREPAVVRTRPIQYQAARSAETGAWQVFRKDDECHRFCVNIETKPNDPALRKDIVATDAP